MAESKAPCFALRPQNTRPFVHGGSTTPLTWILPLSSSAPEIGVSNGCNTMNTLLKESLGSELDFIQSGSVTERVGQAFEERARDLYEVVVFVGQ